MFYMLVVLHIDKRISKTNMKGLHLQWITKYYSIEYRGLRGINTLNMLIARWKNSPQMSGTDRLKIGSSKKKPEFSGYS